jgi:hypothetical protein
MAAGAAILVLVGLGLAAAAVHDGQGDGPGPAHAFLAAQRRSLAATWMVEQRFTRLVSSRPGQPLVESIHDAQRPPDHLIISSGGVDSVFHGRRMACGVGPDGQAHCRDAGVATPYAEQVKATMASLMTYVLGPNPPYGVTDEGGGCFVLRLRPARVVSTTFGIRSEYCFDPTTSAPVRVEVDRPEGQDVTVATTVTATVSDADLMPPA